MKKFIVINLLIISIFLAACSPRIRTQTETSTPLPDGVQINSRLRVTEEAYFTPSLGFDAIRPIYQPTFLTVDEAPIETDELIIGIEIEGQAKAYPLKVLRFREMVNDELAGLPLLVTF